ncbi:MAG TPA: nuclear transport factor 2 family protein [Solirubrobacterales bacterium]|nr:nuclear transport factor 2 family protein [Solirubrobacterales bacterium]
MSETLKVEPSASLGSSFAEALARKDFDRIGDLLHPEIDFRGLTPRRNWVAGDPDAVIGSVLRQWFEDSDEIEELVRVETDVVADRERVAYRFRVRNPEGLFLVEQQVYLSERDGRIGWMRTLCSGYRPIEEG